MIRLQMPQKPQERTERLKELFGKTGSFEEIQDQICVDLDFNAEDEKKLQLLDEYLQKIEKLLTEFPNTAIAERGFIKYSTTEIQNVILLYNPEQRSKGHIIFKKGCEYLKNIEPCLDKTNTYHQSEIKGKPFIAILLDKLKPRQTPERPENPERPYEEIEKQYKLAIQYQCTKKISDLEVEVEIIEKEGKKLFSHLFCVHPPIIAFISEASPIIALQELSDELKRLGITLICNGLSDNIKMTEEDIKQWKWHAKHKNTGERINIFKCTPGVAETQQPQKREHEAKNEKEN